MVSSFVQVPAQFSPQPTSERIRSAVSEKIQEEKINPYPDIEYQEVATSAEIQSAIADMTADSVVKLKLTEDITYDDANLAKITQGTLVVDLNGKGITVPHVAFNSAGENAKIIINDSVGEGWIQGIQLNSAAGVLQVVDNGTLILNKGEIYTRPGKNASVLSGVHIERNGKFIMNDGLIKTYVGCAVENLLGSVCIKGGTLYSMAACAIDICGHGAVEVSGDAEVNGGIIQHIGNLIIKDNAVVKNPGYATPTGKAFPIGYNLGEYATCDEPSGVSATRITSAITITTGLYGSDEFTDGKGNDLNLTISGNAKVSTGYDCERVSIGLANTAFDQNATINLRKNIDSYKIYDHAALDALCKEGLYSRTLKPEISVTALEISGGKQLN